ncbi:MAG: IS1380 family transposase, partial [Acidimicrobiia bacterium]|nr:IS1380 family transposase [Acidimicrobiia bacterium]
MKPVSHNLDRIRVRFDDDRSVATAGLLLPVTLGKRLGLPAGLNRHVSGRDRRQCRNAAAKAMTMISSLLAGGEFISDVAMLSSGATERVLGHRVVSESRCGEWLRSLTSDDVEGLATVNTELVAAGWEHQLGPDLDAGEPLILDIDSTLVETYGVTKEGTRASDYLGRHGYQPLICAEASTGQVIAARLREGNANPARDAAEFLDDTFTTMRPVLKTRHKVVLRADSGFYTKNVVDTCRRHRVGFSITIRQQRPIRDRIAAIANTQWRTVEHTTQQRVDVGAVDYMVKGRADSTPPVPCRLIVRRTTTPADTGEPQPRLFDLVEYHAFVTDQPGHPAALARQHRRHAVIETVIRDLKHGVAVNHMPSSRYQANAAWLQLNILAYNLARLTTRTITTRPLTTKTFRHRYLTIPGRITTGARTPTIHLPTNWPWARQYTTALAHTRTLTA